MKLDGFRKVGRLVERGDRSRTLFLVALMVLTAIFQMVGIGSIMPFLALVADPAVVHENSLLSSIYVFFGFQSERVFLVFTGVAAFSFFATGLVLQALSFFAVTRFAAMQQYKLSERLMSDYLRRPYAFFLTRNSSDLAKTVLQETSGAVSGALLPAMQLIGYLITALAIVVLLIAVDPVLAVSVAAGIAISYASIYALSKSWLSRIGKARVHANMERFRAASDAFAGVKEIRLLGREADYLARYGKPAKRFAQYQASASLLRTLPTYGVEAIAFGGVLLVVLFLLSSRENLTDALPILGLYGLAGKQLIPAVNKIFGAISEVRFNLPAVEVVLEDLDSESPDAVSVASPAGKLSPVESVVIRELSYRYPGAEEDALKGISFCVRANTSVGIIGASGAGKSTLLDLLLGLLTPDSGGIFVDGVKLDSSNVAAWQETLGYVPQHIFLADQSVSANVALGVAPEQVDHAAVELACRLANLHEFITTELPQGYATLIGDRGVRLSGGQRQRIGIARALYRDPAVLVFDEATSALDSATERSVMDAIRNLSGRKTVFLVAHRLNTVRHCDQIFVFSDGELVERGPWEELERSGQSFRRLLGEDSLALPIASAAGSGKS